MTKKGRMGMDAKQVLTNGGRVGVSERVSGEWVEEKWRSGERKKRRKAHHKREEV